LLSIVCPFYNEQEAVEAFFTHLIPILKDTGEDFEIICVNDGSQDDTLSRLLAARQDYPGVRIVDLSRNYGKEAALTAGIDTATGDAVIPIDADLQDPPEVITLLLAKWREGFDVVLAKRVDRASDSWGKRTMATMFYRLHNRIADVQIPENVGDFRLMDRIVVDAVRQLPERRRFMKGIFAWVGFRTTVVEYVRESRSAGYSKFNGWRLWNFALDGITAFSTAPLRIWSYFGLVVAGFAFLYGVFIISRTLLLGIDLPGYASLLAAVLFLGGIQLIGLGVIGEYLGRVYNESKQRPIYLIRKIYNEKD
jgi:glycosyltransferase involved in cell wall biosynthesis